MRSPARFSESAVALAIVGGPPAASAPSLGGAAAKEGVARRRAAARGLRRRRFMVSPKKKDIAVKGRGSLPSRPTRFRRTPPGHECPGYDSTEKPGEPGSPDQERLTSEPASAGFSVLT